MQSIGDSNSSTSSSNTQSVQLPTICYPTGLNSPPIYVDSSQQQQLRSGRQHHPFNLQSLQYRTTTFTQLQVAQTTFRYPPTPPVDITSGSTTGDNMLPSSCSEVPTLSHLNYIATGDHIQHASTVDKTLFASLPTPPDLVSINEMQQQGADSRNMTSSQTCKSTYFYPTAASIKQQWPDTAPTDQSSWTAPHSTALVPSIHQGSSAGLSPFLFHHLPQQYAAGDSKLNFKLDV